MSSVAPSGPVAGDPPGRIVVTSGGAPTAEQIAAVVVALTPTVVQTAPVGPPPWRRAAMLEGTGHPSVHAPADLDGVAPAALSR